MFLFNYSTFIDPLLQDIRVFVPEFSGMKKGDRVLDVCCGTGDQVFHYIEKGIAATGIDSNPKMIELARKRKKKNGLTNVSFRVADAKQLPFGDNHFDFVSVSLGMHESGREERNKIISEMKRVVKKEGLLIFIDFKSPLPKSLASFLIITVEYFAGREHFKGFRDYLKRGGLPHLLKENGLVEQKRSYLKGGIITIIKART